MSGAKELPNGEQLSTWKAIEKLAAERRKAEVLENRARRRSTWHRWRLGFKASGRKFQQTHTAHADRAALCKQHGVANSGRQWVKLRKRLAREDGMRVELRRKLAERAA